MSLQVRLSRELKLLDITMIGVGVEDAPELVAEDGQQHPVPQVLLGRIPVDVEEGRERGARAVLEVQLVHRRLVPVEAVQVPDPVPRVGVPVDAEQRSYPCGAPPSFFLEPDNT